MDLGILVEDKTKYLNRMHIGGKNTKIKLTFLLEMASKLVFIYDGQCPFCNQFAELLELKSNLPNIQVKNARENPSEVPQGYDMDVMGAILLVDGKMMTGANAINWICSQIKDPSNSMLKVLSVVFTSSQRTKWVFPFLLIARRISLFYKGVPRKFGF